MEPIHLPNSAFTQLQAFTCICQLRIHQALFMSSNFKHSAQPTSNTTLMHLYIMPQKFPNPFRWVFGGNGGSSKRRNTRSSVDKTRGSMVQPGTALTKAQYRARMDSKNEISGLDGQSDPKDDTSFTALGEKIAKSLNDQDSWIGRMFPERDPFNYALAHPSPANLTHPTPATGWRRYLAKDYRTFVITTILFLIVFGTLWNACEYLLFAIRASACSTSTVYIPVTQYASDCPSTSAPLASDNGLTTSAVTIYSTSIATETFTAYVTMTPPSGAGPSYSFSVNSAGSTEWMGGNTPPADAGITIVSTVEGTSPSISTTTATVEMTSIMYSTITVPAYTSTVYSAIEPDVTVTSTSTCYMTYTLSRVGSQASAGTAGPRPSYSGPGAYGWNSTTVAMPNPTEVPDEILVDAVATTLTEVHYFGDGDSTTSTTTNYITTSFNVAWTTTIMPSVPEPSDGDTFVTTVTDLPVTITFNPDETGPDYSTSIAFTSSVVSAVSMSATTSPYQTGVSSVSAYPGTIVPVPSVETSGSPLYTNSTSPATMSAAGYSIGTGPAMLTPSSAGPTAGAVPTSRSGTSPILPTSPVSTGPGPVSTSPSQSSTSPSNPSNSSSSDSLTSSSSQLVPLGTGSLSQSATLSFGTLSTIGSSLMPSARANSSRAAPTSSVVATPSPYSSLVGQSSSSSDVTAGPASASSATTPGPSTKSTTSAPISTSYSSMASVSSTLSTSVRSMSGTASSSSSVRSGTASLSPAGMSNTTLSSALTTSSRSSSLAVTQSPSSSSRLASSSSLAASSLTSNGPASVSATAQSASASQATTASESIDGVPATASALPSTGCGEYGDFMLDFDNLPNFTSDDEDENDITQAPPIFSPYHHFTFSEGYVYAPDPKVPFEPISEPHIAVFLPDGQGMRASQARKTEADGEISDGPYESSSAFWFDAFSAWLGCDNEGPETCTLVMQGYTYSDKEKDEVLSYTQNATLPGCPGFEDCQLQKVLFPADFRSLSGLQIQAYVGNEEKRFFMDDVAMRWTDNSCEAGLLRQRTR